MCRAVNVRVLVPVEMVQPIQHGQRLLRGGGVVEPDQRPAVHALLQDRKVAPHRMNVEGRMIRGGHLRNRGPCRNEVELGFGRCGCRGQGRGPRAACQQRTQIVLARKAVAACADPILARRAFCGDRRPRRLRHSQRMAPEAAIHGRRHDGRMIRQPVRRRRMGQQRGGRGDAGQRLFRRGGHDIRAGGKRPRQHGSVRQRPGRKARGQGGVGHRMGKRPAGRKRCRGSRKGSEELVGQCRQRRHVRQARRCGREVTCSCRDSHGTCRSPHPRAPPAHRATAPRASSRG
ncbi:hypothetical protein C8J28_12350 [Cereibacter azotoformans]|uniref:Uncharacterized protein n=1 Tax=Cereibacter azotoformans TaxID=43057 RepID=A0A2T5JT87_9RHOB|nr:hypothetical protein C8J28_12350 [Cereibacter azotoformans]